MPLTRACIWGFGLTGKGMSVKVCVVVCGRRSHTTWKEWRLCKHQDFNGCGLIGITRKMVPISIVSELISK